VTLLDGTFSKAAEATDVTTSSEARSETAAAALNDGELEGEPEGGREG